MLISGSCLTDLDSASTELLAQLESHFHGSLDVTLQAATEVPEHGGASGEHDVLVQKDE